jgi:hypothetical protein
VQKMKKSLTRLLGTAPRYAAVQSTLSVNTFLTKLHVTYLIFYSGCLDECGIATRHNLSFLSVVHSSVNISNRSHKA